MNANTKGKGNKGNKNADTTLAPVAPATIAPPVTVVTPPVTPVAKVVTVTQNGQNYPRVNTIGYVIWQVIATMHASASGLPTGKQLLAVASIQQYKPLSITATLAHYRKFYGIRGTQNVQGATLAPLPAPPTA